MHWFSIGFLALINFSFDNAGYLAPSGGKVDFSFSTDRNLSLNLNVPFQCLVEIAQEQTAAVTAQVLISADVQHYQPHVARFSQVYPSARSPIKLEFNGEIIRLPPIRDGGIGVDIGLHVAPAQSVEASIALMDSSTSLDVIASVTGFRNLTSILALNARWATGGLLEQQVSSLTDSHIGTESVCKIGWQAVGEFEVQVSQTTFNLAATDTLLVISLSTAASIDAEQHLPLFGGFHCHQNTIVGFDSYNLVSNANDAKWGEHLPSWICSTRYVPPVVGAISLTFTEPFMRIGRYQLD